MDYGCFHAKRIPFSNSIIHKWIEHAIHNFQSNDPSLININSVQMVFLTPDGPTDDVAV